MTSFRALILAGVVLAGATPAAAHSLLLASTPAANAQLTASPPYVVLRFNNRIEKSLSGVRVLDARGVAQPLVVNVAAGSADRLVATVPPLAPGAWTILWQVLSTDGHVVTGRLEFRVGP